MKFNLTRFINLIKRDYITHRKSILFICLGFWGLILSIVALNVFFNHDNPHQYAHFWFPILIMSLLVGCLTFTALIFKEFKTRKQF